MIRRWIRHLMLCCALILPVACGWLPRHTMATPLPPPGPLTGLGRGPLLAIPSDVPASVSTTPAPFERIPFTFSASAALAVYDDASKDVLVFPGAGFGLENTFELNPWQFYFDDSINIYLLDVFTEERIKLVDGREVGGFAFSPAFDGQNDLYFIGTDNPASASQKIGFMFAKTAPTTPATGSSEVPGAGLATPVPYPLSPYLGTLRNLTVLNALAELHGGVSSNNVDGPGDHVVFTTADGGLYLYYTRTQRVQALLPDQWVGEGGFATGANIDPVWGRFVVWEDTRRRSLYVLDRWTGRIDAVPYVHLTPDAVEVSAPNYYGSDPYDIVFTATLRDGTTRLYVYDVRTERLRALVMLNAFRGQFPVSPSASPYPIETLSPSPGAT